jgi:hypothetical protein
MSTRIKARLSITALDFDPDQITRETGLAPAKTWVRGSSPIGTKFIHKECLWRFATDYVETWEAEGVLKTLIAQLEPHRDQICRLAREQGLELEFAWVVEGTGIRPAYHLDLDVVHSLAQWNAELDIDDGFWFPEAGNPVTA